MYKLLIPIVCLSVMIWSCNKSDSVIDNSTKTVWECTEIGDSKINIEDLIRIDRILGLEDGPASMVGGVDKIIRYDSLLFIMDSELSKKIFLFNS